MVVGQRWVLKHEIKGDVSADDFELVEEELPAVKDGEIMIKTTWISVDPYQVFTCLITQKNSHNYR